MNDNDIKKILLEEVENKKRFTAHWDTVCDECGDDLWENDPFTFMGNKRKICDNCLDVIIGYLEN